MQPDGRFAPSPTGPLHLGSLRTALVAWLFARSQSARFLLRIEDLDPQRSRREFEAAQIADLRALGLDWDEEPVRQSERLAHYQAALEQLRNQDRLYPCFCTRAEIREAASAPHGAAVPGRTHGLPEGAYPGTCRRLTDAERGARIGASERFALRLRADAERISFHDRILGEQSHTVDDFVVVRSDGVFAYQLAVVVDDGDQGVGEVVRGADLVDSTPRQVLLQRLLSLPTPSYAHIPLVLAADGSRLAKRTGGASMAVRGDSPQEALTYLARTLGLADSRERVLNPAELVPEFDARRVPRAALITGA